MPLTKSDIPDLLLPGLKTEFSKAYRSEVENSIAEKIATVVNTTMPVQKYAWLGATPPMREFIDERRLQGMSAYSLSIEDKVFESTISVDRRAIEDDQLDMIKLRIRDLASRVSQHRHQIVVQALLAGGTGIAYDGLTFFNGAHPGQGSSTYSNTTTSVLSATALASGISTMMQLPDDAGIPLGIVPDTLVVGPQLMWDAIELVESPVVVYKGTTSTGTSPTDYSNAFMGRLRLIVSPYITGSQASAWFLLDTKRPIKGLILQQRSDVPVEFSTQEGSNSSDSFMRDRFNYGVRARYNVGYGLWQAAYGGKLS